MKKTPLVTVMVTRGVFVFVIMGISCAVGAAVHVGVNDVVGTVVITNGGGHDTTDTGPCVDL